MWALQQHESVTEAAHWDCLHRKQGVSAEAAAAARPIARETHSTLLLHTWGSCIVQVWLKVPAALLQLPPHLNNTTHWVHVAPAL
jgi:hypothetical protein